jgi:DNA polymerase IV
MDLDAFFVSVECLRDSRLLGRPVIIGGKSDRGVVAACSYEARHYGVHSAMPIRTARHLCPHALIISGDMEAYSRYSKDVTEIIAGQAPLFEKSSIDEFYLDVSGMDRFFGCYQWTTELRKTITRETGLPISFALSTNKMVAKVGTNESKPNGQRHVQRGMERPFLAPLSIDKIPMLGEKTCRTLNSMGIERVHTLREVPPELLEGLMGKHGIMLWKRANAIDESPVIPHSERKSISTERTFQKDTIDVKRLREIITGMTEKLAFQLRKQRKLSSCISVKIRYSNFDTESKQKKIPYTASDATLIKIAGELFEQLYTRRMLLRLVGVRLSGLVEGRQQIHLFDQTEEEVSLHQALDGIRFRYGEKAVNRGSGITADHGKMKTHTSTKVSSFNGILN